MSPHIPAELMDEARSIEAEILEAFKGVSREGGVSWSEAEVIDEWGLEDDRFAARAKDADQSWMELANDSKWDVGPGMGGFSFLDPIGFRYYLPAAMIRTIQSEDDPASAISLDQILTLDDTEVGPRKLDQWQLLNERQRRCVARFLRFMIALTDSKYWRAAYDSHWKG